MALRSAAVFGTPVAAGFPDSLTYRATPGGPHFSFVSLTGHAIRPWVVPLFYRLLPSDNVRGDAQVLISMVAWLALAAVVALALRAPRLRAAAFVIVLLVSCAAPVSSWDRTILSESLSISLAVGALAAWIRFAKKPAPANSVAVVVLSGLWIFTKLGLFPIVAVAAVLVAIAAVRAAPRALRIAVAGGLAAMCVWAAATTSATDKAYAVVDGMSTSQFDNLFAMRLRFEILANPGELNWFESHGMPDPTGLQPYTRASPVDDGYATWTTFLAAYAARTDLATWVENKGRPVFERYVLTHPRKFASDFIKALPYMLAPPRTAVVYTTSVRDVLPDAVQSLVFDTPSDVRPTLGDVGLLAVALGVLSVVARRRTVDRTLVVVAAVGAVLAIGGLAASWIASPAEIARHAVPEAVLLRLSLWLGVFVGIDALQTPRIAPTRRGSSDRAARRWRAPSIGARSAAPRRGRQA